MPRRLILSGFLVAFATAAHADAPVRLDEGALRYYASLGQKDRVAAETRRLQKLDPAWRVPEDLYATRPGRADEAPLWDMFAQDRLDDLDHAVALRQAAEPGWTPSPDLVAKLKAKRLRAEMIAFAGKGSWRDIVRGFKASGIGWAKDDAEALWIIAEAYARENDCGEAYIVYRSILANHDAPAERLATIEHAIAFIPMAMTEKLIAMGRKDGSGKSEFEPIALDITRARISAFLHDEPAAEVSDDERKKLEDVSREATDPNQPGLIAWYAFKRRDYAQALDWFKLAIGKGGDAMVAHGLAHTLRKLGMKREAEEVAYAWREPLVNNSILFIDLLEEDFTKERPPLIEPARVARYAQVTMATESGEGAQALAWYAYNTCQYPLALQWFEHAVAWLPKEATAYGYGLALQRMHRGKEFREIVNRYDGLFPKVVGLAFDDGIRRPPPPCEATRQPVAPVQAAAPVTASVDWTGRTMADTLRPQAPAPRAMIVAARPSVPSPDAFAAGAAAPTPVLKKKTDFPFAVTAENPLRFSALRTEAVHVAQNLAPLVARRVPGVGVMPYERFGFTLAPGWDGTREASSPTAAERNAPVGTLWALEQSLRDGARLDLSPKQADTTSRAPMAKASLSSHPDGRT